MHAKAKITLILAYALSLAACGTSVRSQPQSVIPAQPPAVPVTDNFKVDDLKYAAAVIIEGGKGDPWFDDKFEKHEPVWRLYICIEPSESTIEGTVDLDFAKLGTPYERTFQKKDPKSKKTVTQIEQLAKVTVNYSHQANIESGYSDGLGKYAYGKTHFSSKSEQSWELASPGSGKSPNHAYDLDIFDMNAGHGTLMSFKEATFKTRGTNYYIATGLQRMGYGEKDKVYRPIAECEARKEKSFILIGSEIPRN